MAIPEWPEMERPREKLLDRGVHHLSNAELLAILFGSGTKGKSAVDLARELLNQFVGLRGIFAASFEHFSAIPGLGLSKYCQCQAALELSRRHLEEPLRREGEITEPEHIKHFIKAELRDHQQEVFACIFLDNRHRMITFEKLFYGTIDATSIHPRVVVQRALHHNAAAVIVAHNHPSGVAKPSQADRDITNALKAALTIIDVRLLDHLIVGDQRVTSFAERGLLA